jgi:hypothetical protein
MRESWTMMMMGVSTMTAGRRVVGGVCLWVLLAGLGGCAAKPRERPREGGPVDTGAGTLTAARKFLEGRWSLESFQVFPAGKPPVAIKGQGTVVYDDFSNLSMDVRVDAAEVEALKAAGVAVVNNGFSTSGRAVVDMTKKTLTYVMSKDGSISRQTGPLDLNLPRHWEVEADKLTLTTKDAAGKPLFVSVWRRMP